MLAKLRKLNNELKEMSKREGEKWSFKMKSDEQTVQLMRNNLTDSMQLLKEERLKRSKLEGEVSTIREKVYVLIVLCDDACLCESSHSKSIQHSITK
jgi:soluble cytochrome b562